MHGHRICEPVVSLVSSVLGDSCFKPLCVSSTQQFLHPSHGILYIILFSFLDVFFLLFTMSPIFTPDFPSTLMPACLSPSAKSYTWFECGTTIVCPSRLTLTSLSVSSLAPCLLVLLIHFAIFFQSVRHRHGFLLRAPRICSEEFLDEEMRHIFEAFTDL